MFAFSNVLHLFTDELSRLCGRRLSFARVAPRTLECLSFRHSEPPNQGLHKSLPFGHHSEPAGGPLLEMIGSARKIPVVHYRPLTQLPSGPLWCLEKTVEKFKAAQPRRELRLDFRSLPWRQTLQRRWHFGCVFEVHAGRRRGSCRRYTAMAMLRERAGLLTGLGVVRQIVVSAEPTNVTLVGSSTSMWWQVRSRQ